MSLELHKIDNAMGKSWNEMVDFPANHVGLPEGID
jgi:hypothetical protein